MTREKHKAIGLDDAIVLAGIALIAVGCWEAYRPASFIVPGILLVWYALPTRPPFIEREPKAGRS